MQDFYTFLLYNKDKKIGGENMAKYVCSVCGYVYDEATGCPENDVPAGTKWSDVDDDFVCPVCGAGKDMFSEE